MGWDGYKNILEKELDLMIHQDNENQRYPTRKLNPPLPPEPRPCLCDICLHPA